MAVNVTNVAAPRIRCSEDKILIGLPWDSIGVDISREKRGKR